MKQNGKKKNACCRRYHERLKALKTVTNVVSLNDCGGLEVSVVKEMRRVIRKKILAAWMMVLCKSEEGCDSLRVHWVRRE